MTAQMVAVKPCTKAREVGRSDEHFPRCQGAPYGFCRMVMWCSSFARHSDRDYGCGRGLDADLPIQRANERTMKSMTGGPL